MVAAGRLPLDLLYRVNGYAVALAPLRERADRRALIARLFAETGGARKRLTLDGAALDGLDGYAWPGNVRELCSVLKALAALAPEGSVVEEEALPAHVRAARGSPVRSPSVSHEADRLVEVTRHAIDQMLASCDGQVALAARRLGVHRSTVYRHLARQQPS